MNSTFGDRLRLQREQKHISLATIAERTKIKLSLLEALERDDASRWPRGIFGRSYLRAYAQAVGLDPDATVREFAEWHPEPAEPLPTALADVRDITPDKTGRRPPMRLQFLIDSAIDAFHARRAEAGGRTRSGHEKVSTAPPVELAYSHAISPADNQPPAVDFLAVAHVCTRIACAQEAHELTSALEDTALILDASGVILWIPDARGAALMPVFAHGYSDEVLGHLPPVFVDADNATAAAFRGHTTCVVNASDLGNGALVAPLLTPAGCAGVLALELRNGAEQREEVRASVTILAAQMSTLVGLPVFAQTLSA